MSEAAKLINDAHREYRHAIGTPRETTAYAELVETVAAIRRMDRRRGAVSR